jgi:hypothetical protein
MHVNVKSCLMLTINASDTVCRMDETVNGPLTIYLMMEDVGVPSNNR